jgi:hypothetical protein
MKEVEQEVNAEGQGMLHSNEPISSPRAGSHSEDPNSSYGSFDLAWTTVKSVFCTLNKIYKMYNWMDGSHFYTFILRHIISDPRMIAIIRISRHARMNHFCESSVVILGC